MKNYRLDDGFAICILYDSDVKTALLLKIRYGVGAVKEYNKMKIFHKTTFLLDVCR